MNITREQSHAARCFLDWSRNELAAAAKVSPETIKNFEHGVFSPNATTRAALIETFEAQGLEFIEGGVRRDLTTPALVAWDKLRDDLIYLKREGPVAGGFTEVGWQAVIQRMETIKGALNGKAAP